MIEALIEIWNTDISAKLYLITIGAAVLIWGYFMVDLVRGLIMRKPITVWERYYKATKTKPARYEHNHIENGHTDKGYPKPMCNEQMKDWYGADGWKMTHAYLDENNVVIGL